MTLTDIQGNTVAWSSAASCGYRGSRKSTPYAAGEAASKVAQIAVENFGMKNVMCVLRVLVQAVNQRLDHYTQQV